ncbi:inorganic pyrophosphatase [Gammaproteobacteria bacterium SCGC AG-212-F23]|nr:inorganic pyrophosphatase [Gammaproteobacteria bacterium SCGC AG-212-F23]
MSLKEIEAGRNVPDEVNVVIEIPSNSDPVKYEVDKATGVIMVDRFVATSMSYPCDYGYIPHTLAEDGDPMDVLLIAPFPLLPGVVVRCRPIGLLRMTDESGPDAKILVVPIDKLSPRYKHIQSPQDLGEDVLASISHFFSHYKDLEKGKWVKIDGWENVDAAKKEISASVERYKK